MTFLNKQISTDLVAIFFFLIFTSTLKAQKAEQSYTSEGNFQFEEVISDTNQNKNELFVKAYSWLNKNFNPSNMVSSNDSALISNKGTFKVYNKGLLSKEIHGAIHFDVSIATKNGKYKYEFNNFRFEYYKQNRQYKYVPTGKYKSLEDVNFPGWQSSWERYKKETKLIIENYISDLKKSMKNQTAPDHLRQEEW